MSASQQPHTERRSRTREIIDSLLAERQELLVSFCRLAGVEPHPEDKPAGVALREFCQILVDYTAAIHFEVYTRVAEGKERRELVLSIAKDSYPRIAEITQRAVDFNDEYADAGVDPPGSSLQEDLSRLGEELALRFELEDKLFNALLSKV